MLKYIALDDGTVDKLKIKKGKIYDGEPDDFEKAISIKLVREATKLEIDKAKKAEAAKVRRAAANKVKETKKD